MRKERTDIPLCEYDAEQSAVVMPGHENLDVALLPVAVFAFLGDLIDEYAKEHHLPILAQFVAATKL